jgi:nucleoside-diphosphate-sugar epimerase
VPGSQPARSPRTSDRSQVSDNDNRTGGRHLVTGATGFLGESLVRRLVRDRTQVRALVRSREKAAAFENIGVDTVVGDVNDERAVAKALDGVAVVYHLAGKLFDPASPANQYRRTHVGGTTCLIEQCAGNAELRRFVHCSTTGVVGATGTTPAGEDAPMRPTNAYEATKAEAEVAVRTACARGLPAVIVRPGLVYGPGDLHLLGFYRAVVAGRFRPIGHEPVFLHPVYIDDMTEAFLRCASHPNAVGECYNIAGREPVTLAELAHNIAHAAGSKTRTGHIPLPVARAAARVGDLLPTRYRNRAPLTTSRLDFLTHSRVYSVSKAELELGFVARTDLRTGIELTVAWYREHGYLPR